MKGEKCKSSRNSTKIQELSKGAPLISTEMFDWLVLEKAYSLTKNAYG